VSIMKASSLGHAGLQGWRSKVADAVATPVAKRSSVSEDQVRSLVGAVFLVLTLAYLLQALKQLAVDS
jgi:multidrug transporter EmrE-like cation transporter